jgi:hypothetical protein
MRPLSLVAIGLATLLGASTGDAACLGTGSFSTCTDASGNHYTVNRFGNQTMMNGYNASTGYTWIRILRL